MPPSRSFFKKFLIVIIAAFCACDDISRDNILDPKNPESYRPLTTTIEAFVNTENDQLYNKYMISALNQIQELYGDKVTIAHFHRNAGSFTDSLSLRENEILYENYIGFLGSEKGVPDVFINGPKIRIKGASSTETARSRIEAELQAVLLENSLFTIEPDLSRLNGSVAATVNIARLGSFAIENIYLKLIVTEKIDHYDLSHVVRHIQFSNLLPAMEPGERKKVTFSTINLGRNPNYQIIISVISEDDLSIMQSVEVPLP